MEQLPSVSSLGACQGDPILAYLLILKLEILIKDIEIFEHCFLHAAYSDDTIFFSKMHNLLKTNGLIIQFEKYTGWVGRRFFVCQFICMFVLLCLLFNVRNFFLVSIQVFSCETCKTSMNSFLYKTPPVTTSGVPYSKGENFNTQAYLGYWETPAMGLGFI